MRRGGILYQQRENNTPAALFQLLQLLAQAIDSEAWALLCLGHSPPPPPQKKSVIQEFRVIACDCLLENAAGEPLEELRNRRLLSTFFIF
jgi:hypothetical protein